MPRAIAGKENLAKSLADDLHLARREVREGSFQRTMAVIAAFSAIVSGFEAYTQHLRGAFRHWLMWTPVGLAAPVIVASIAALFSERAARQVLPVVSVASLLDGVVGFVFHLRGIQKLPGGFRLGRYNVVIGPPISAPLLMGVVGVLGLLASVLRPEVRHPSSTQTEIQSAIARTWGRQSGMLDSIRGLEGEIARGSSSRAWRSSRPRWLSSPAARRTSSISAAASTSDSCGRPSG